jgi:hypothetical protein
VSDSRNSCPYCPSNTFDAEAKQEVVGQYINQCSECRLFSVYDEKTDTQLPMDSLRSKEG